MAKPKKAEEYQALTTMAAKAEAIASAKTAAELDAMWAAWEERGFSRAGLLFAAVLARKAELGVQLSEADQAVVDLAAKRQKEGSALPPIKGKGR